MVQSLLKIRSLPDHTKVYCAHEYTLNNANFALSLDPFNEKLKKRSQKLKVKDQEIFQQFHAIWVMRKILILF